MRRMLSLIAGSLLIGCAHIQAYPALASNAEAAPQVVQTGSVGGWQVFNAPSGLFGITPGKDGALWMSFLSGSSVARMDLAGNVTSCTMGGTNYGGPPITRNQDGNVYVGEKYDGGFAIASVTPTCQVSDLPIPAGGYPRWLVSGSDGNIWISRIYPGGLGRLTPSGTYTDFTHGLTEVYFLAAGPDGNVWATAQNSNGYVAVRVKISDGSITSYPIPYTAGDGLQIAAGVDNGMWIAEHNQMVRVDITSGAVSTYAAGIYNSSVLVAGPNRLLYWSAGLLGEYSPTKHSIEHRFHYPQGASCGSGMAEGPDSQIWVTCGRKVAVLIVHAIVPEPASVSVSVGKSTPLSITEPKSFQKSFTVVSNNQSIATVSGSGTSFTVTGVSSGSTTLTASDIVGNSLDIPVTVH